MAHLTPRQQFIQDHGGNDVKVNDTAKTGLIYFPDGAAMEPCDQGLQYMPDNPYERAGHVVRYWAVKLERAADAFHGARQQLRGRVAAYRNTGYDKPTQDDIDALKPLREEVLQCKAALSKAQVELDKHRPASLRPNAHHGDAVEAQRILAELETLNI